MGEVEEEAAEVALDRHQEDVEEDEDEVEDLPVPDEAAAVEALVADEEEEADGQEAEGAEEDAVVGCREDPGLW